MRQILLEAAREWSRPSWLLLIAGHLGVTTLVAVGASEDHALYFHATHVLLPLGLAPLAARTVARDTESGMALVQTVSGFSRGASLAGKAVAIFAFIVSATALTLPVTFLLVAASGEAAMAQNFRYVGWAMLIGAVSACIGLLLGVACRRSTPAVSAAFGVAVAWVAVAESAPEVVRNVKGEVAAAIVTRLLHVSPVMSAYDALQPITHTFSSRVPWAPAAAVTVSGLSAALAAAVLQSLQDASGWRHVRTSLAPAWAAAGLLITTALLAGALPPPGADPAPTDVAFSQRGFALDYQGFGRGSAPHAPLRDDETLTLNLQLDGVAAESLSLEEARVASPHVGFRYAGPPLPIQAFPGPEGRAFFSLPFVIDVNYGGGHIPVHVNVVIDGEPLSVSGIMLARAPAPPSGAMGVTGLAGVVGLAAAAFYIPRRLNSA